MITNRNADEDALGIDVTSGSPVTLSNGVAVNSVVSVNGTAIGKITADGGAQGLAIAFDDTATVDQVEALLRVLTYVHTSSDFAVQRTRDIAITLTNDGGNATTSNVTVDVKAVNAAPVLQLPAGPLSGCLSYRSGVALRRYIGARCRCWPDDHGDGDVLDDKAKGVLLAGKGGSYDATTGVFTYHGTAGATEALRNALQFHARDRSDPIGTAEKDDLHASVTDGVATSTKTLAVDTEPPHRRPRRTGARRRERQRTCG